MLALILGAGHRGFGAGHRGFGAGQCDCAIARMNDIQILEKPRRRARNGRNAVSAHAQMPINNQGFRAETRAGGVSAARKIVHSVFSISDT